MRKQTVVKVVVVREAMHENDRRIFPQLLSDVDPVLVPLHKRLFVGHHSLGDGNRRTIMKVFALGLFAKPLTDEQRKRILPKEVPNTLRLYLDGKIDQF